MKSFLKGIAAFLVIVLLCISFIAADFYKRECGTLQEEYRAAKTRIMSLAIQNKDLKDKLTYLEQQYEPFIKILK